MGHNRAMRRSDADASITEEAYRRLREDLLGGRLPAGRRLKIGELCQSLSLNLSAVREALSRLSSEGLVSFEPQRGYRAMAASPDELRDLTAVRIEVEASCLRRALRAGDLAWEEEIVAALHRLLRTPKPVNVPRVEAEAWFTAHARFHEALVAACDSPWLLRLRALLYTQTERYRRLSVQPSEDRDVDGEHRALMQAALLRDANGIVAVMAAHFEMTTSFLLESAVVGSR